MIKTILGGFAEGFTKTFKTVGNWTFDGKIDKDVQKARLLFWNEKYYRKENSVQSWDVMLNPSSIRRRIGRQIRITRNTDISGDYDLSSTYRDEHLSMQLIFDMVDIYDAYVNGRWNDSRTWLNKWFANGVQTDSESSYITHKYPSNFKYSRKEITEDKITLANPFLSCLPYLIYMAGSVDASDNLESFINFSWGGLSITGYITDLSVNYTYFSPKGYPLRAYTDLTIYRMPPDQIRSIVNSSSNTKNIAEDLGQNGIYVDGIKLL